MKQLSREELEKRLPEYLLLRPGTKSCNDLVGQVMREWDLRGDNRPVSLDKDGDPFTIDLIRDLLRAWGIQVEDCRNTIYAHLPKQRIRDIPRVASFVVHRYLAEYEERQSRTPTHFGRWPARLLLCTALWRDFTDLKDFIETQLVADWHASGGCITESDAVLAFRDRFALNEKLKTEIESDMKSGITFWYPEDERSANGKPRRDWVLENLEPMLERGVVKLDWHGMSENLSWYIYFGMQERSDSFAPFPLDAIGQGLENMVWHCGLDPIPGDVLDDLEQIRKSRLGQIQSQGPDGTEDDVCLRWDKKIEMRDLGIDDKAEYDALMRRCHFELDFPEPDDVYERWVKARDALGIIAGSVNIDDPGSNDIQSPAKKFLIMLDDSTVVVDGTKYCLRDKHFKAVNFIAKSQMNRNPWVKRDAVFNYAEVEAQWTMSISVRNWFIKSGGNPKRFAEDGHIITGKDGTCRLNAEPESIEFITSDLDDPPTD